MNYYPFDSRNKLYRSHIGAEAAKNPLRLGLLLHKDACVYEAFLRIEDDSDKSIREIPMLAGEWLEDYLFYECEITLDEGLYWYDFRYTSAHGQFFVVKSGESLGIVSDRPEEKWQQTVYDSDFVTPDWLKGGIIYQIFPDRFYNSGAKKENVPDDRFICNDWYKTPEHRQINDKCTLGNDYYGGDLKGIEQKLPYLKSLGVTCIYLNPIFEAHSNHRYNTADYCKIDTMLGDEQDFKNLCRAAKKQGISIILDGVFSHTGDDSIYFNRNGRYGSSGAFNDPSSPYLKWFNFKHYPNDYDAWWGIKTLPETNENNPDFTEFITGENGILRRWLRLGANGWRLDVADELPDLFLDNIRNAIKAENHEAFLLGEVWEDATNKISYGARRRFLRGGQLDSVMNYPFANAIIQFVRHGNSEGICNTVLSVLENYPPQTVHLLMNHIGTHDTARILTVLGQTDDYIGDRNWQAGRLLSHEEYHRGLARLRVAAVLQYTLPGVPSLYYGDEAGMQGYCDPFCRATYPWDYQNSDLLEFYRNLGSIRLNSSAFKTGEFIPYTVQNDVFAYIRRQDKTAAFIAVNRGEGEVNIILPPEFTNAKNYFGVAPQGDTLTLSPYSYTIITI
ncbi:MAG: glycoside hydrolase family 13 protein [Acutalibacteraceae bacterium]|nr:glycoside hydrolase family 13 protein [Acutalibacteraceae bacterium]